MPHCLFFSRFVFTSGLILAGAPGYGQTSNRKAGDDAWSNINLLGKSAVAVKPTAGPKTVDALRSDQQQRASGFRQVAQAAKNFYTQYPDHPKAADAKKLEALAGIEGITDADALQEQAALAVGAAFRADKTNSASSRYEVAHAMERRVVGRKLGGRSWFSHPIEGEMMADRLRSEFGELPEVYGNYLALAELGNCDNGRDVALRILQLPAPAPIKAAARRLLERFALIRKPLDFPLTTAEGKTTTVGQLAGKLTVVCFWDGTRQPGGPSGLHEIKKDAPPGTKWIYVSLGVPARLAKGAKAASLPAGATCVEALGRASPLVERLKIERLPFVYVLDEKQNLSAYGRIDELPWLLTGVDRLIAP